MTKQSGASFLLAGSLSPLLLSRVCPAPASSGSASACENQKQRRASCRRTDDFRSSIAPPPLLAAAAPLSSPSLAPLCAHLPLPLSSHHHHHFHSQVLFTMAALPEIKLFGKWSYEDVEVRNECQLARRRDRRRLISLSLPSKKRLPLSAVFAAGFPDGSRRFLLLMIQ